MLFVRFIACCVKVTTTPLSLTTAGNMGLPHCPQGTDGIATPAADGHASSGDGFAL